jgi:hypothetical protein
MARPYSEDLWERMVWAVLSGQSRHEVARMFDVSASAPPLPRWPCGLCGVALVTAQAVANEGGEDGEAHQ